MNLSPLVSFCMSTYKRPEKLKQQLIEISKQTYSNFEVIISDNDEEGSAKVIVDEIQDKRFLYHKNIKNLGMIPSFNKSIERSSGEFIIMITDDDPPKPDLIETLIKLHQDYPNFGLYCGYGDWINENKFSAVTTNSKIGLNSKKLSTLKDDEIVKFSSTEVAPAYFDGFFSTTFLLWSCCMVKKEILTAINGIPNYGSELIADHAYVVATGSKNGLVFINKSLGSQVVHGDNFGYNFEKVKAKYEITANGFYNYLEPHLAHFENWNETKEKLWNFVGRSMVEYSLMIFHSFEINKTKKKDFFISFNKAFENNSIKKWKYKFYLKAYCKRIFKILLKMKNIEKS